MAITKPLCVALVISTISTLFVQGDTNTVAHITQQEIIEAALYGKIDVVKQALTQRYELDQRDPDQRTVLMFAAFNGHAEIAEY